MIYILLKILSTMNEYKCFTFGVKLKWKQRLNRNVTLIIKLLCGLFHKKRAIKKANEYNDCTN